jgi:hypothetical protein
MCVSSGQRYMSASIRAMRSTLLKQILRNVCSENSHSRTHALSLHTAVCIMLQTAEVLNSCAVCTGYIRVYTLYACKVLQCMLYTVYIPVAYSV